MMSPKEFTLENRKSSYKTLGDNLILFKLTLQFVIGYTKNCAGLHVAKRPQVREACQKIKFNILAQFFNSPQNSHSCRSPILDSIFSSTPDSYPQMFYFALAHSIKEL